MNVHQPSHRLNRSASQQYRSGKILIALAVSLPALFAVLGLYIDGSMMLLRTRELQAQADAAATAAAFSLMTDDGIMEDVADDFVRIHNGNTSAVVTTHHPPLTGDYAGNTDYVAVTVQEAFDGFFSAVAGNTTRNLRVTAVAGIEPVTEPAAVVVLEPDPEVITYGPLLSSLIPGIQPQVAGLEVLGLGELVVDGAVLVNNEWGGVDENGEPVGETMLIESACACTPLLTTSRIRAADIHVVGGVDSVVKYSSNESGSPSPLKANCRPTTDPLIDLTVPTSTSDPSNVDSANRGTVNVVSLPLVGFSTTLQPGVYDSIQIVGGRVTFEPGIYIIKGANPLTGISLLLAECIVNANDVMFYITDSSGYSVHSGLPDGGDEDNAPPSYVGINLGPSVVMTNLVGASSLSPLDDPSSPYDGMLLFQRRWDRRPIILIQTNILCDMQVSGHIYAKWAPLFVVGNGTFESAMAVGSLRTVVVGRVSIEPTSKFDGARDVFLVE